MTTAQAAGVSVDELVLMGWRLGHCLPKDMGELETWPFLYIWDEGLAAALGKDDAVEVVTRSFADQHRVRRRYALSDEEKVPGVVVLGYTAAVDGETEADISRRVFCSAAWREGLPQVYQGLVAQAKAEPGHAAILFRYFYREEMSFFGEIALRQVQRRVADNHAIVAAAALTAARMLLGGEPYPLLWRLRAVLVDSLVECSAQLFGDGQQPCVTTLYHGGRRFNATPDDAEAAAN